MFSSFCEFQNFWCIRCDLFTLHWMPDTRAVRNLFHVYFLLQCDEKKWIRSRRIFHVFIFPPTSRNHRIGRALTGASWNWIVIRENQVNGWSLRLLVKQSILRLSYSLALIHQFLHHRHELFNVFHSAFPDAKNEPQWNERMLINSQNLHLIPNSSSSHP